MQALHERLIFDAANGQVLDQSRRYVLMRADVLMGLFEELPEAAHDEALRAFGRSVARHGIDSLRAYAAEPGVDAQALQRVVESAAASLGWGRWQLTQDGSTLSLEVRNSPFAAASAPSTGPACHAIAGMLEALATVMFGHNASARESACAASDGTPCCRFSARIDSSPLVHPKEMNP